MLLLLTVLYIFLSKRKNLTYALRLIETSGTPRGNAVTYFRDKRQEIWGLLAAAELTARLETCFTTDKSRDCMDLLTIPQ